MNNELWMAARIEVQIYQNLKQLRAARVQCQAVSETGSLGQQPHSPVLCLLLPRRTAKGKIGRQYKSIRSRKTFTNGTSYHSHRTNVLVVSYIIICLQILCDILPINWVRVDKRACHILYIPPFFSSSICLFAPFRPCSADGMGNIPMSGRIIYA